MRLVLVVAAWLVPLPVLAQGTGDTSFDVHYLRNRGVNIGGAELVAFVRKAIPTPEAIAAYHVELKKLASRSSAERAKAAHALVEMGPVVRPLLRQALQNYDLDVETRRRVGQCLDHYPADYDTYVMMAAARVLARNKADGALAVLFDYLPYAINESVRQELQTALNTLVADAKDDKPLRVLLSDKSAPRRAAAVESLLRAGRLSAKEAEKFLADPSPQVRFQTAIALIDKFDKAGLQTLIALLPDLAGEQTNLAMEYLIRVGGADSPGTSLRDTNLAKMKEAWTAWYAKNEAKLDLAKAMKQEELGITLVTSAGLKGLSGVVAELSPKGEVNWKFEGIRYPLDIQYVARDRVLVAEYLNKRVTERDTKGTVLWEKAINMPIACQRLPNGDTFIASRQSLTIVDRDGKDVFTGFQQAGSITAAVRLRDGHMVAILSTGQCHLLDPAGKEVRNFRVGQVYTLGGNIDILPNGRLLVPLYNESRVVEIDLLGNVHAQFACVRPTSAIRLKNGNTLVTQLTGNRVLEVNPQGGEVSSWTTEGRPWRVRRR